MIVTSALSKAASVAALSPISQVKMWLWCLRGPWAPSVLSLRSSRSTGASGAIALNGSTMAGSFLVVDVDRFRPVGGDVAVVGDDEGDLLVLEEHLLVGEHGLHVAGERRHVVEAERLQVGGGEHGEHAGERLAPCCVDRLDPGVGVGRADEVAVEHAGQLQVVDVVALALDEADVLDALALAAEALELLGALGGGG